MGWQVVLEVKWRFEDLLWTYGESVIERGLVRARGWKAGGGVGPAVPVRGAFGCALLKGGGTGAWGPQQQC